MTEKKLIGINRGYGFTMFHTYKRWYKRRKGKRWVWYCEVLNRHDPKKIELIFSKYASKEFKQYINKTSGPKKPRGKRCKEFRRIIKFHADFMKNNYTDYTKCSTVVDTTFPGDDTVYKYKVLKPEDNAKFEAIVTKRIDELKGEE